MNARREHESKEPKFEYQGPLDILIVSPPKGEPWFIYFKKDQLSKHGAFQQMKVYISSVHQGLLDRQHPLVVHIRQEGSMAFGAPPRPLRCACDAPPVPAPRAARLTSR